MRLYRRYSGKLFTTTALSAVVAAAVGLSTSSVAAQSLFSWLLEERPSSQIESDMGPSEPTHPRARRASEHHRWTTANYGSVDALGRKIVPERTHRKLDSPEAPKAVSTPGAEPVRKTEALKPRLPLFLVVSIADQHVSVYNHDGLVARSAVSTGVEGHPTPRGIYTIIGRERYHASNLYSGAPMPYMQRVTWSGVAMHVGVVPGHPASHGCIRLPAGFAVKLWGMTRIGERVVISPHETTPDEFAHPLLPAPKMRIEEASGKAPTAPQGQPSAEPTPLNPLQYAERLKAKASAEKAAAAKAARESAALAAAKQAEAARLQRQLDDSEAARENARAKLDDATKAADAAAAAAVARRKECVIAAADLATSLGDGSAKANAVRLVLAHEQALAVTDAAAAAITQAEAVLTAAQAKVEAVRQAVSANDAELLAAEKRSSEASAALEAATNAEKEALRRLTPVSLLVSKKDSRIYVRQGLAPLFDAPVKLRDPERPLGSHLFIASAANEEGTALKWTVLSWPVGDEPRAWSRKLANAEESAISESLLGGDATSASEALDRIEIAQDVRDRIGELLWVGGSLIVSDQPPSSETGNVGTDLTVKLR